MFYDINNLKEGKRLDILNLCRIYADKFLKDFKKYCNERDVDVIIETSEYSNTMILCKFKFDDLHLFKSRFIFPNWFAEGENELEVLFVTNCNLADFCHEYPRYTFKELESNFRVCTITQEEKITITKSDI